MAGWMAQHAAWRALARAACGGRAIHSSRSDRMLPSDDGRVPYRLLDAPQSCTSCTSALSASGMLPYRLLLSRNNCAGLRVVRPAAERERCTGPACPRLSGPL